ncbi:MAG: GNAT family N-acetyltransferase [Pyrinomonadaceae bacterium]|nr:GNAT family N-acetyltransferase [Pyrinomonadaceae bacterium]
MNIEIIESTPSSAEYVDLRKRAGLSAKSIAAAEIGLPNSLFAVSIRHEGRLVGMGRVIGDGACFFEIVDIAVDPDYQGQGFGKKIMLRIDSYVEQAAMEGSYVSMIADQPEFYKKLGYKLTAPESQGMYKRPRV